MKKIIVILASLGMVGLPGFVRAQTPSTTPTQAVDNFQVEKLQLEIERLKLENQRLQLQIQTLQMAPTPETKVDKSDAEQEKKEVKKLSVEMKYKAEDLAKQNAYDDHMVILDFSNREIWYKGVRAKVDDFARVCSDQKWKEDEKFLKYDMNGDSLTRYRHQNMYLDRYGMQPSGVFVFEAPVSTDDFRFVSPEGVQLESSFSDIRNRFESPYFKFANEDKDKDMKILRFKHGGDLLGFADVVEFWFDSSDHFVKLKWGLLDKK